MGGQREAVVRVTFLLASGYFWCNCSRYTVSARKEYNVPEVSENHQTGLSGLCLFQSPGADLGGSLPDQLSKPCFFGLRFRFTITTVIVVILLLLVFPLLKHLKMFTS